MQMQGDAVTVYFAFHGVEGNRPYGRWWKRTFVKHFWYEPSAADQAADFERCLEPFADVTRDRPADYVEGPIEFGKAA